MLHIAFMPVGQSCHSNTCREDRMMSAALKTIESRRAPRDTVSFRASVTGAEGMTGRVFMVDLSPFGFMARGALPVVAGDVVTLRLPHVGERSAIVRWSLGGRMGGEFEEEIPAHGYARMLATAPHDRPAWNEV
jgi:hypothetical protein